MAKAVLSEQAAASTQNIYQLDGKVPLLKAIPFGLQHILAMFVANLTPITLIGAASRSGPCADCSPAAKCDVRCRHC